MPAKAHSQPPAEPLAAIFGRRLRLLREASGLTQQQLGDTAGVDYKHIGSIERGEKTPSFEAVEKLATTLKVDYFELFLPDDISGGPVDTTTRAAIRDLERLGSEPVKRFVRDVLAAARKLAQAES